MMEHIEIEVPGGKNPPKSGRPFAVVGVVTSSNLEVMAEPVDLNGKCQLVVDTKASGFKDTWVAVFEDFVSSTGATDVRLSVNDFSAIAPVVRLRLEQAWESLNQ